MQRFEKMYTLLLLLIAAKGNVVAISDVTLVAAFLMGVYGMYTYKIPIPRFLYWIVGGYLLLTSVYFLKFGEINFTSSMRVLLKMLTGILALLVLRDRLFIQFERYMRFIAGASLFFFAIQLVDYGSLKQFVGFFENTISALNYRDSWYVNNFIFTLNDNAMTRNSGFAWEPKGFANLLLIALVVQLLRTRLRPSRFTWLYVITLITTQSTTGLVVMATTLPAIVLANSKMQNRVLTIIASVAAFAIIFSLNIVGPKIAREFEESDAHLVYIDAETDEKAITLGRFGSWKLAMMDLPKNPLTGVGMQDKFRTEGEHTHLVYVNGLADFLSRFGILGLSFLAYCYARSCRAFFRGTETRGWIFFFLLLAIIFFASAIIIGPFFFALQFYFLLPPHADGIRPKINAKGATIAGVT
jgi:hypothetical protein